MYALSRLSTASALVAASTVLAGTTALAETHSNPCADNYSMTDVDGNGYISPIEINAYAEAQVAAQDTDQSGTISRDEYVNCSMQMMQEDARATDRIVADLDGMDTDDSGTVSPQEYVKANTEDYTAAKSGDTEAEARATRSILILQREPELTVPMLSLEEVAARAAMLHAMLDTDQDGALTEEEYLNRMPPKVDISETMNREFEAADTDASGDLTTTELIAANTRRSEAAQAQAEEDTGEAANPDVGAPVVYYTYPSTM
ncbi:hypothetical protein [Pseudosulfitobacter koreensis]|uniref:EF-hand domain-containing protein n=1 Tax=Pseudosulfitobacter koreensis TaxID=2968472 RepID=A0ABT1Z345_9RHOB|nr:hypothetical protein [Pseudosulfitobacter koreense]MCR8827557.1 hypothetical protein [Pseudosulfitobacter koreense]